MTHIEIKSLSVSEQIKALNALEQGDVLIVDLWGSVRQEQEKTRTCVVVSNKLNNKVESTLLVVPITTLDPHSPIKAYEVEIQAGDGGLKNRSAAQPHQVRTIDRHGTTPNGSRVRAILGRLSPDKLEEVLDGVAMIVEQD